MLFANGSEEVEANRLEEAMEDWDENSDENSGDEFDVYPEAHLIWFPVLSGYPPNEDMKRPLRMYMKETDDNFRKHLISDPTLFQLFCDLQQSPCPVDFKKKPAHLSLTHFIIDALKNRLQLSLTQLHDIIVLFCDGSLVDDVGESLVAEAEAEFTKTHDLLTKFAIKKVRGCLLPEAARAREVLMNAVMEGSMECVIKDLKLEHLEIDFISDMQENMKVVEREPTEQEIVMDLTAEDLDEAVRADDAYLARMTGAKTSHGRK